MLIRFHKYHGTGNDFIMVDDRGEVFPESLQVIAGLCRRRFGIGADGLILLRMEGSVPRMVYYNSDGRQSTMCGNGGRCFVAFCQHFGLLGAQGEFLAVDGPHPFRTEEATVSLRMQDVPAIEAVGADAVLDTGSPHYVRFCEGVEDLNVSSLGMEVRFSPRFREGGINVNFVAREASGLMVRTYERGVEAETMSCGTGVTAAVLAFDRLLGAAAGPVAVRTLGGDLSVSFQRDGKGGYTEVWLHGPATKVFEGQLSIL